MKTINMDPDFTPFGGGLEVESFDFPSGCEPHFKLLEKPSEDMCVTARISTMNDLFRLAFAAEILDHRGAERKELFLPFVPCARQDRRMTDGEPLSAKIVARFINSMGFDKVSIFDPHSDVISNAIDNCHVIPNHSFVESVLIDFYTALPSRMGLISIVSPDAGSIKKSKDLLMFLNGSTGKEEPYPLIKCDKTRDVTTGNITGFEVSSGDVSGRVCVIVDDICDGGGTFTGLGRDLKRMGAEGVILIVSHGIFSKNLNLDGIDYIYTTDSVKDLTTLPSGFKQFQLCRNILF